MSSIHSQTSTAKGPSTVTEENEYGDAEKNFQPKSLKFWIIIIGVYLSIFLVALDRMIIATAIPSITNEFHSIADIGWYGSAYMLTTAIFNPLFGKIYQLYSIKWVYLTSIIIFEIGSAICGAAPTSNAFIIGRSIAGIGAAGIFCGGIMMIVPLVPLRKRPVFTSFFGLAFGISSVLGPLIGGTFTDNTSLTWRWCFYINLPIGAFTIVGVFLFLHLESAPREKLTLVDQLKRLDPVGLLFFVPSMVCLILVLQWGGTTYPWSAPKIIGLLVAFIVLLIAFLAIEIWMPDTAMVPMRVVLNRSMAGAMFYMFLLAGAMMNLIYYLTIWFQAAQGQSAMQAGIRTIPLVLCMVILGIVTAVFVQKIGYYVPAMLICPAFCAVASGLLSTLTPSAGRNHWIGYQVIYGIGLGMGFQTSNLIPQSVLPRADVPIGMALMFSMQQLGGSVFLSVGQNIFSNHLVNSLSGVAGLDTQTIIDTGATALRSVVPPSALQTVIDAYSHALTRVFILAAALSACMILGAMVLEWKNIKGKKTDTSNIAEADLEKNGEESNVA